MLTIKAYASDISEEALKIAKTNTSRLLPDFEITILFQVVSNFVGACTIPQ